MTTTLYQRLGEAKGIASIVENFVAAHLENPVIKSRFVNVKDLEHAKRMAREFFCAGAGGPESYTGKDMLTAHKGMNISEQEYMAAMDDVVDAMNKHEVDKGSKNEVVAILYSLKDSIIRV